MEYVGSALFITFAAQIMSAFRMEGDTLDFYNYYYAFPEEYTDAIDNILVNSRYGVVTYKMITGEKSYLPYHGKHYFYSSTNKKKQTFFTRTFITLEKKEKDLGDRKIDVYHAYVRPYRHDVFVFFLKKLFESKQDEIQVISIDTSAYEPKMLYMKKIYHTPRPHQVGVINKIVDHYKNSKFKNTKIILSGERGAGKTSIGVMVAKEIMNKFNVQPRIYDDFDPSAVGVNIKSFILKYASGLVPVIIIINEIDIIYDNALSENTEHDPRLKHSKNKNTLNEMFDSIANTKNVIAIYTTEKSPEYLDREVYRSFIREGRVDLYAILSKYNKKTE